MKKSLSFFIFIVVVIGVIFVYPFYNPNHAENKYNGVRVAVTIFPVFDLVKKIGGKKVFVKQIIPFGQEPHSFEPTPKEIIDISNSELFIFTGLGIDYWAKDIGAIAEDKRINLSKFIQIKNNDPHFWLDSDNLALVAKEVTKKLSIIDIKNKNYYNQNLEKYLFELNEMNEKFKKTLSKCKLDTIIVTHDGFKYLANKYNFNTVAILGLSPDEKPSAKTLSDIIDLVKSKHISTVFFEELIPTITIETISNECNVSISELSPLGNIPQEKTRFDYSQLMYHNLKQLKGALHCE